MNWIIKRQIKKIQKLQQRDKSFLNLKDIKTMLILIFENKNTSFAEDIKFIINDLEKRGIQPEIYMYSKNKETFPQQANAHILSKKDITWWHGIKKRQLSTFTQSAYDAVMDLSVTDNQTLTFITAVTNAKLKMGIMKKNIDYYDFILENKNNENSPKHSYETFIHYLNQINVHL